MAKQGGLTEKVREFLGEMERLVSNAKPPVGPEYWEPLERFVAVNEFRRLVPPNAFASSGDDPWEDTVMDWPHYVECFNLWASASPTYANVLKRIAEFPDLVYLEIEEHHSSGGHERIFNSLSAYQFDDEGKICRLRVASAADQLTVPAGS